MDFYRSMTATPRWQLGSYLRRVPRSYRPLQLLSSRLKKLVSPKNRAIHRLGQIHHTTKSQSKMGITITIRTSRRLNVSAPSATKTSAAVSRWLKACLKLRKPPYLLACWQRFKSAKQQKLARRLLAEPVQRKKARHAADPWAQGAASHELVRA